LGSKRKDNTVAHLGLAVFGNNHPIVVNASQIGTPLEPAAVLQQRLGARPE
jgi:hypothetical protein